MRGGARVATDALTDNVGYEAGDDDRASAGRMSERSRSRCARYPHDTVMAEEGSSSGERRPRPRRWRRRLARACVAALVLLGVAYTSRTRWFGPLLVRYLGA